MLCRARRFQSRAAKAVFFNVIQIDGKETAAIFLRGSSCCTFFVCGSIKTVTTPTGIGVVCNVTVNHRNDTAGVFFCQFGVVSYHNDQLAAGDLSQNLHNLHAGCGIQSTRRLVGKNDVGVVDKRTRDSNTLHLTAGELRGLFVNVISKSYVAKRANSTRLALVGRNTRKRQCQLNVCQHRLVRDQVVALENKADGVIAVGIPIGIGVFFSRNTADYKVTAGILVKTADDVEQCCLSATRGTQNGNEFVFAEAQVDSGESAYSRVTCVIIFYDSSQFKQGYCLLIVIIKYCITCLRV